MADQQTSRTREIAEDHLRQFAGLLREVNLEGLERIVQRLRLARDEGRFVFIAGNGGSAATASHFANDLGKMTRKSGGKLMRVMSLSDNVSYLTALANDEGYEHIFSRQLENFAQPKDVLIVISASGNSPNLVRAVELARKGGLLTIGFLGFDGGVLKKKVDECLWVRTAQGAYGLVESGHALVCHILAVCLAEDRQAP